MEAHGGRCPCHNQQERSADENDYPLGGFTLYNPEDNKLAIPLLNLTKASRDVIWLGLA